MTWLITLSACIACYLMGLLSRAELLDLRQFALLAVVRLLKVVERLLCWLCEKLNM